VKLYRLADEFYVIGNEFPHFKACWELINGFFDDPEKSRKWFLAKNPLLGDLQPIEMIWLGRGAKLLKFIKSRLDGYMP
jgi:hypothetical protein